jgi:octaprenyl-diphosphate synthase
MKPDQVYRPIAGNLARVDRLVAKLTGSRYAPLTGGKRLRPALLLFAAGAWDGRAAEGVIELAAAVELVHAASLVHDDVIDSTVRRRSGPALHRLIGVKPAVIFADLLFVQGLALLDSIRPGRLVIEFIHAVRTMCEGQWLEVEGDRNLTEDRYTEIIDKKTAAIFAFAGRAGARLGRTGQARPLEEFGREFGFVYQLLDDARDLGHRQLTSLERQLRRLGGASWCRRRAATHADLAQAALARLTNRTQRAGLEGLLELALTRGRELRRTTEAANCQKEVS